MRTRLYSMEDFFYRQCNYCNNKMADYRYKCLECQDYDLCCSCFQKRKCNQTHKINHIMIRLSESGLLFGIPLGSMGHSFEDDNLTLKYFSEAFKDEIHTYFECNVCKKEPIKGLRLRCDTCYDFNVCLGCHTNHDQNHSFIAYGKTMSLEINEKDLKKVKKRPHNNWANNIYLVNYKNEICMSKLINVSNTQELNILQAFIRRQLAFC